MFLGSVLGILEVHLKGPIDEEKHQAVLIFNDILQLLENQLKNSNLLFDLLEELPLIMKTLPSFKQNARLDIVTCFLVFFHLMRYEHWERLFSSLKEDSWQFLVKLLQNFQSFIRAPTYPDSWIAMNMFQYSIILKACTELAKFCLTQFNNSTKKGIF